MDLPVIVKVGDRETSPLTFSYDPPFVEMTDPKQPDANGDIITIHGRNFGPSADLAGKIFISIGQTVYADYGNRSHVEWYPCVPPLFGAEELMIWQQKGTSSPYLWCQSPRTTVGPKHLRISVAGQNVTYLPEDMKVNPGCLVDYYGQEADAVYYGGLGSCGDVCSLDSWRCMDSWDEVLRNHTRDECRDVKHCEEMVDPLGMKTNCTVISRHDEYCVECPGGADCKTNPHFAEEPESVAGYWKFEVDVNEDNCGEAYDDRKHRSNCYEVVPCAPAEACEGGNVCGYGYTGEKCNDCCDALHRYTKDQFGRQVANTECFDESGEQIKYFRQYGECAPCPSNPWMIVAILLGGATSMGTIALIMKKRRVSLGIMSIAVDYFQILALLSSTKTPWPQIIRDLYTWLSAFNFNINITAPECVFEVKFEDKWRMQIAFPFLLLIAVFVYNWVLVFIKKYVFNKRGRKVYSHSHKSVGLAMSVL